MPPPVFITGLGLTTHLARGVPANWQALTTTAVRRPRSDAGRRTSDVPSALRAVELAEEATQEALTDAGLWQANQLTGINPERLGCMVSASKPLNASGLGSSPIFKHSGQHASKVDLTPEVKQGGWVAPDAVNGFVSRRFGVGGESRNVIAACATGAYSIALAASWIEQGVCEVVLTGSVEPYPHPLMEAGFRQMGVVSADGVTRPFDHERSGFSFGEGAGVVVLESAAHLAQRGGRSLARLSGWALGADSHSAVAFNSNGARISRVIDRALDRAALESQDVRHVNAHGTGTRLNDWIETQALITSFGSRAGQLMISATKSVTGHLLGASGSVEFILTVLALTHQFILPTATLQTPDPDCPLDYTPRHGHAAAFDHALSLSFGFGGPIGALVVSR